MLQGDMLERLLTTCCLLLLMQILQKLFKNKSGIKCIRHLPTKTKLLNKK